MLSQANSIYHADCLELLRTLPSGAVALVYVDPPFNTGKRQAARKLQCKRISEQEFADNRSKNASAYRGFGGHLYVREQVACIAYDDNHANYISWLQEIMLQVHRVLSDQGSLFLHLDCRETHYAKVMLDEVFGRNCFQNEIIWAYDFGARSKSKWSAKHDTILWYSKDPRRYCFNYEAIDRIPYLAPALAGKEKAQRGKTPTDVWWNTIVPTQGNERTGYPNQKPLAIVERIIRVHSKPGEWVLDFFAGSGTTGEAAARLERRFILADIADEAIAVMRKRLARYDVRLANLAKVEAVAKPTSIIHHWLRKAISSKKISESTD